MDMTAKKILEMIESVDPSDEEVWRDVVGYEGRYIVSSFGRIMSMCKNKSGRIMVQALNSTGRPLVSLYRDKKKKSHNVHCLVAEAFIGIRKYGDVVRHKNGNVLDNRVVNLQYGTPKDNSNDRKKHGTMNYGSDVHNSILSESDVLHIRDIYKFRCGTNGTMALAKKYNVSPTTISAVMSGQNWSHLQAIAHERGEG